MRKNVVKIQELAALGLDSNEAVIYLELLRKPATHAQLSLLTGINRTTLYRIISSLEKRGLVGKRIDDQGSFLFAVDPASLEADVIAQEQLAKHQRRTFGQLLPQLEALRKSSETDFSVSTYKGVEGFKRLLWHELKTKEECLCLSAGPLEDLVPDSRWVAGHRQKIIDAGYTLREILNEDKKPSDLPAIRDFFGMHYRVRFMSSELMPLHHMTTVYNNTVATYNVYEGRRIGLEITSRSYAQTTRSIFELLWEAARAG